MPQLATYQTTEYTGICTWPKMLEHPVNANNLNPPITMETTQNISGNSVAWKNSDYET